MVAVAKVDLLPLDGAGLGGDRAVAHEHVLHGQAGRRHLVGVRVAACKDDACAGPDRQVSGRLAGSRATARRFRLTIIPHDER